MNRMSHGQLLAYYEDNKSDLDAKKELVKRILWALDDYYGVTSESGVKQVNPLSDALELILGV